MDPQSTQVLAQGIAHAAAFLGAGICMGIGSLGPGTGQGYTGGKACESIARSPEHAGLITRAMLIGQAVTESCGIYALVIALLLIFTT